MSTGSVEPRGEDANLQQQFFDIVLSLEGVKDGFDHYPRPLNAALTHSEKLPEGHIVFQGDFHPPARYMILLAGKPASGKTTISREFIDTLVPNYQGILTAEHISIGDTLRGIQSGDIYSRHTAEILAYSENLHEAQPLPNKLVSLVVTEAIQGRDEQLVLLDGYPRFADQLSDFNRIVRQTGRNLLGLVEFVVPDNIVTERLRSRPVRDGEASYNESKIDVRLREYYESVSETITALAEFFKVHYEEVDASGSVESAARALGDIILRRMP